jgi:prepilin-type N-terminal cleavage/methylation domain-containing protein
MEGTGIQAYLYVDGGKRLMKREKGFTMVELLVTMTIFVLVIAAASEVFTGLITQFKQQSKIAETDTGGIAGLEILRRDIAQAGYGLPWVIPSGVTYRETTAENGSTPWVDRNFNDGPDTNPQRGSCSGTPAPLMCDTSGASNPPAPFRAGDGDGSTIGISASNGTSVVTNSQADVLVIKAASVGMNDASQKWTYISNNGALPNMKKIWNPDTSTPPAPANYVDDLRDTDQVIVLSPGSGTTQNELVGDSSGHFYTTLGDSSFSFGSGFSGSTAGPFEPAANSRQQYVVYGIAGQDASGSSYRIRMPFNRADYYIKRLAASDMPGRCAKDPDNSSQGTGILYKSVTINTTHNDGNCPNGGGCLKPYPLLDCVADMQVVFLLDTNNDGIIDVPDSSWGIDLIENMTAAQIRKALKEVRVYIVAQEGQRDANYDFSLGGTRQYFTATIIDPSDPTTSWQVPMVNLKNLLCPTGASSCAQEYKRYHWKLYTLVVKPDSMN